MTKARDRRIDLHPKLFQHKRQAPHLSDASSNVAAAIGSTATAASANDTTAAESKASSACYSATPTALPTSTAEMGTVKAPAEPPAPPRAEPSGAESLSTEALSAERPGAEARAAEAPAAEPSGAEPPAAEPSGAEPPGACSYVNLHDARRQCPAPCTHGCHGTSPHVHTRVRIAQRCASDHRIDEARWLHRRRIRRVG